MEIKGKKMILQGGTKIILERERLDLVALWEESKFENSCVEIKEKDFICNAELFYTQHIHTVKCVDYLLNNGKDDCTYDSPQEEFEVKMLINNLYIYTGKEEKIIVNCNNKEKRLKIKNIHRFPRECFLKIINKFYYEPTIFKEVMLNETF